MWVEIDTNEQSFYERGMDSFTRRKVLDEVIVLAIVGNAMPVQCGLTSSFTPPCTLPIEGGY
jgi:hypothetical protein